MKTRTFLIGITGALAWLSPMAAHADRKLSPELFDQYDRRGYFTPNFKTALIDMVQAHEALDKALAEQKNFEKDLPELQKEAADAQAKTVTLRQQLAVYDHPDENDFDALRKLIHDPAAKAGEVIALAQAYVWTYPTSPHEPAAQEFLDTWQKKLADQQQAEKDAEAAREAAHAALVRRGQAHDLSIAEWRDLLHGLSQDDLVKLFGQPTSRQGDYWFYEGGWAVNPALPQKQGLQINFDAGRVITVDAKPAAP
jgi:hypothetical protein